MEPFDGNAYRKEVLRPLLDASPGDLDPFAVLAVPADEDDAEAIETGASPMSWPSGGGSRTAPGTAPWSPAC